MFVSDLRHFLDLPHDVPAPAARMAEQLGGIVRAATAVHEGAAWVSALPCRRRPGNRRCPGRIRVRRWDVETPIAWECVACGDAGTISGWQDTPYDLRDAGVGSTGVAMDLGVTDEVAASLRETLLLDGDCLHVVHGARVEGSRIVLTATQQQLDELIDSLAAAANHADDRRRRRRIDAAFAELDDAVRRVAEPAPRFPKEPGTRPYAPTAAKAPKQAAGLPDLDVASVQRWCAQRVPEHVRHQVRIECEVAARHLTIVERRPPWREDAGADWSSLPIARLQYATAASTWTLYWRDRNLRFHRYDRLPASAHVDGLLAELDRDPTCIFWG